VLPYYEVLTFIDPIVASATTLIEADCFKALDAIVIIALVVAPALTFTFDDGRDTVTEESPISSDSLT